MSLPRLIEQVYAGKNTRWWRVSRRDGGDPVHVRESALAPGKYTCLTHRSMTCDCAEAVKAFDGGDTAA